MRGACYTIYFAMKVDPNGFNDEVDKEIRKGGEVLNEIIENPRHNFERISRLFGSDEDTLTLRF